MATDGPVPAGAGADADATGDGDEDESPGAGRPVDPLADATAIALPSSGGAGPSLTPASLGQAIPTTNPTIAITLTRVQTGRSLA